MAVAEELHFRRAAARLHATQSAVSQQVKELERRLGVALLTRNRRSVALTDAGAAFLGDATEIFARHEAALAKARAIGAGRRGSLTVGLIGAATFEAMPRLMADVHAVAPDIRFRFREMSATEQFRALRDGTIDAGLVRAEPRAPGLDLMTVMREPVICLMPETHRLARQETVAIADLEHEPLLNLSREHDPAAHDLYLGLYRRAGFEPRIVHEVSQIATILFVIATSGCLALGPAGFRVLRREAVAIRPLEDADAQVTTRLVWNPNRVGSALGTVLDVAAR